MSVITDPLFYAFAVPAVVFLGLSKGGFSGIGMVSTPLLAIIMSPLEAAAILLPIILVQDVVSVWVYRRVWDPWNLKVMIPGCVVGVGMAWLLAAYVSHGAIRLVVGLIALGFVGYAFFRHMLPGEPPRPRAWHGVFWGGLSGFTTTLIQIGAPPYYAFVLPQRLEKMIYVGTTVMFFAAANSIKVVPYFALGQFHGGARDLVRAVSARDRLQLPRHLSRPRHARGDVLPDHQRDRVCAGPRIDAAGRDGTAAMNVMRA
jgi:uncharacterized protein